MSPPESEHADDDEFAAFVSQAIRAPRAGAYEHLLSQFLAQAVISTNPLKRIARVCDAALMVPQSERPSLAIDYGQIETLTVVSSAFLNHTRRHLESIDVINIAWGLKLTEESFDRFIRPWLNTSFSYLFPLLREHVETWKVWKCRKCKTLLVEKKMPFFNNVSLPAQCPDCCTQTDNHWHWFTTTEARPVEDPYWSFFFEATRYLSLDGYNALHGSFVCWALPQAQLFLSELTGIISPGLYSRIIGLYRGKKDYAEKVRDVAEVPNDEDRMGQG